VVSRTGRRGGYNLARAPSAISLLEVIEAVEDPGHGTSCVVRGGPCALGGRCQVHAVFDAARTSLLDRLGDTTLADLGPAGDAAPA